LPDGVMAAQATLTRLVMVRIHVGQPLGPHQPQWKAPEEALLRAEKTPKTKAPKTFIVPFDEFARERLK
jgi:hypothetical protein